MKALVRVYCSLLDLKKIKENLIICNDVTFKNTNAEFEL